MRVIHRCTGERDLCETLLEHECLGDIIRLPDTTTREALFNKEASVKAYDGGKTFTCQCGKCGDTFTLSKYDHMKLHDIAYGKCSNKDEYARSIMARTIKYLHCNQEHTLYENPDAIYVSNRLEDIDRIQEQLRQIHTDPNLTFGGDHNHFDVPLFEMVSCPSIRMSDLRRRNTAETQRILAKIHHDAQAEEDKAIFAAINAAMETNERWTKTTIGGQDLFVDTTPKFVEISCVPSEVMMKIDSVLGKTLQVGQSLTYNSSGELVPIGIGNFRHSIGSVMSVSKDGTQACIRVLNS